LAGNPDTVIIFFLPCFLCLFRIRRFKSSIVYSVDLRIDWTFNRAINHPTKISHRKINQNSWSLWYRACKQTVDRLIFVQLMRSLEKRASAISRFICAQCCSILSADSFAGYQSAASESCRNKLRFNMPHRIAFCRPALISPVAFEEFITSTRSQHRSSAIAGALIITRVEMAARRGQGASKFPYLGTDRWVTLDLPMSRNNAICRLILCRWHID